MAVRVICIKKDEGNYENPYLAIDYLEWVNERINVNGITDRTKIYDWIKNEDGEAYIIDKYGNKMCLVAEVSPQGNKYVRTTKDELADCLLLLPDCA
ncbi:MAG: hypothetical protein JWP44_1745 [Mucilaginibacter sp.]|nr:hypothetical protein [Mucilaginibacter sp.]